MVNRTYAEYKGKIYKWNELLNKLNLDNDGYSSGRIQFYNKASAKQLENTRCLIKDDDEEYVEICNYCEELIDDCTCYDPEDDEEETCEECGELIDNCECEKEEEDNKDTEIENDKGEICDNCLELINTCHCIIVTDLNTPIIKNRGRLHIISEPYNAKILLEYPNDKMLGDFYKASEIFDLIPGEWEIGFLDSDRPKYEERIEYVNITKSKTTELIIKLEKTNSNKLQNNKTYIDEDHFIPKSQYNKLQNNEKNDSDWEKSNKERLKDEEEKVKRNKLEWEKSKRERIAEENLEKVKEANRLILEKEEEEQRLRNEKKIKDEQDKFYQEKIENERKVVEQKKERLQNHSYVPESNGLRYPYVTYNKHGHGNGNGDKKITRARLPNGDVIQWTELLRQLNLFHKGGSAYVNWLEHKRKDINRLLPDVDRIDADGNLIPYVKPNGRDVIGQTKRAEIWMTHFGNVMTTICPCCKNVYDREIRYPGCYELGHNQPHSKEGSSEFDNLIPICYECNRGMGNKYTVVEYRKILLSRKRIIE